MGLFSKNKISTDISSSAKATADKKVSANKGDKKVKSETVKKVSTKDLYTEDKKDQLAQTKTVKQENKNNNAYRILVKPLITEKAGFLGSENKYIFEVSCDANKIEIAKAIKEVYGIEPVSVNIINKKGKSVRNGRTIGKKRNWKKAIIALPEGKTINVYEGV